MATYYIATDGNDTTGDGSESTPWATTVKAGTVASSGDTVIIKNGTYDTSSGATNWDLDYAGITWQAETAGSVIFDFGGTETSINVAPSTDNITINITGIVFTGIYRTDTLPCFVIPQQKTPTVNFTLCTFYDMVFSAASYAGGMIGPTSINGVSGTYKFDRCLFYNMRYGSAGVGSVVIRTREGTGPISVTMYNCIVDFNSATPVGGFWGLTGGASSQEATFTSRNNIFYGTNAQYITALGADTETWDDDYNCVYQCPNGDYVAGANDITSDPLFVDTTSADYRLRQTSPAKDAGVIL